MNRNENTEKNILLRNMKLKMYDFIPKRKKKGKFFIIICVLLCYVLKLPCIYYILYSGMCFVVYTIYPPIHVLISF